MQFTWKAGITSVLNETGIVGSQVAPPSPSEVAGFVFEEQPIAQTAATMTESEEIMARERCIATSFRGGP